MIYNTSAYYTVENMQLEINKIHDKYAVDAIRKLVGFVQELNFNYNIPITIEPSTSFDKLTIYNTALKGSITLPNTNNITLKDNQIEEYIWNEYIIFTQEDKQKKERKSIYQIKTDIEYYPIKLLTEICLLITFLYDIDRLNKINQITPNQIILTPDLINSYFIRTLKPKLPFQYEVLWILPEIL